MLIFTVPTVFQILLPRPCHPTGNHVYFFLFLLLRGASSSLLQSQDRRSTHAKAWREREEPTATSLTTGRPLNGSAVGSLGSTSGHPPPSPYPNHQPVPEAKFLGRRGSRRAHSRARESSCESVAQFRLNLGEAEGSQGGGQKNFLVEERAFIHIPRRRASASSRGPGWGPRFQENSAAGR